MKWSVVKKSLLLVCCNILAFATASDEGFCTAGDGVNEASCRSKIDLYYIPGSAPCRSVRLAANAVGVDLNLKLTNLQAREHMNPDFIKMNPQHKVPTMNDNGFLLGESRAIMGYLVDQYAKDDTLYPMDTKKRAVVNQRLYFDIGTVYQRFSEYYYPLAFEGASPDPKKMKSLEDAFEVLDKFLEAQEWVAGDSMTIADISLMSSVSSPVVLGFDLSKFKNVARWFDNCKKSIPDYEEIAHEDLLQFKKLFQKVKLN